MTMIRPPTASDPSNMISDPLIEQDDIDGEYLEEPRDNLDDKTVKYEDIDGDHFFDKGKNNDILGRENFDHFLTNTVDLYIHFDGGGDIDGGSSVDYFFYASDYPTKNSND